MQMRMKMFTVVTMIAMFTMITMITMVTMIAMVRMIPLSSSNCPGNALQCDPSEIEDAPY